MKKINIVAQIGVEMIFSILMLSSVHSNLHVFNVMVRQLSNKLWTTPYKVFFKVFPLFNKSIMTSHETVK